MNPSRIVTAIHRAQWMQIEDELMYPAFLFVSPLVVTFFCFDVFLWFYWHDHKLPANIQINRNLYKSQAIFNHLFAGELITFSWIKRKWLTFEKNDDIWCIRLEIKSCRMLPLIHATKYDMTYRYEIPILIMIWFSEKFMLYNIQPEIVEKESKNTFHLNSFPLEPTTLSLLLPFLKR